MGSRYPFMTTFQKYALQERDAMIKRDGYLCWKCGVFITRSADERGFLLKRSNGNIGKYGKFVMNHHLLLAHSCPVCSKDACSICSESELKEKIKAVILDLQDRGLPYNPILEKRKTKAESMQRYRDKKRGVLK